MLFRDEKEKQLFKKAAKESMKWTMLFWLVCIFPLVLLVTCLD